MYEFSSRRTRRIENIKKQRKSFPEIVYEIISKCDIVLEVLDARFIDETRNSEIEEIIKQNKKKLIYVLNKSDLIDKKSIKKKIHDYVFVSCKERKGGKELREKIKSCVKKLKLPYSKAQVGVIGYPNTGKSSVINLLIGKNSAKTAHEAGFTKGIQRLKLTQDIWLLDTPGVIPFLEYSQSNISLIAQNTKVGARNYDKVKEPEFIVSELMKNNSAEIESFYNIHADGDSEILIEKLGRKNKLLNKGNEVDIDRTARRILKDWQEGRIRI